MKPRLLLEIIAIAFMVYSMTSCTVTLNDDGSKSATLDGEGLAHVINAAK